MPIAATTTLTLERAALSSSVGPLSSGPDLAWMATAIVISLSVLVGVGFLARRVLGAAWRSRAERRSLGVIDVLPLGGRRQLLVVRCYDRTLALGVGDREVSLLAELDSEVVAVERKRDGSQALPSVPDFRRMFDRARGALRAPASPAIAEAGAIATAAAQHVDVRVGEVTDFVLPVPEPRASVAAQRLGKAARAKALVQTSRDEVVA